MKVFACVVLLATVAFAAPEGKRDKRGFLYGDSHGFGSVGYGGYSSYSGHDFGFGGAIIESAPAARVVSVNKVVEVPKVITVNKLVSVPKVVSVPQIVKVNKIVAEPHISHVSSGWW